MSEPTEPVTTTISRTNPSHSQNDTTDSAINLVDTTTGLDTPRDDRSRSQSPGLRNLTRDNTRTSLRESIKRRKYAKWSQERVESRLQSSGDLQATDIVSDPDSPELARPTVQTHESSEVLDFAHRRNAGKASGKQKRKVTRQKKENKEYVVDILYENQRGSFFCGIPLYSHSSLLNFDPAPWVTKDFKDSPVNITNAQVPDPSWEWDWKHWYVDMSGDVDEDGWQYSFAFFGNFAWHGTHPWFHSYVRRRRWLRRRVKKPIALPRRPMPSSMSAAHRLNADYFTIHSRQRTMDDISQLGRAESYASYHSVASLEEDIPEDVNNIASLLKAIRLSTIDREKIDAVKRFVDAAGEELFYLQEHIPEIMSVLVFQNSRRQLLEFLQQRADEAQRQWKENNVDSRPEADAEKRKADNLSTAADVANGQIIGLEYWSDRKQTLLVREDTKETTRIPLTTIFDKPASTPKLKAQPADNIKGISEKAEIDTDPNQKVIETIQKSGASSKTKDKGKAKAKETESGETPSEDFERLPSRLRADQVLIPDEDV